MRKNKKHMIAGSRTLHWEKGIHEFWYRLYLLSEEEPKLGS